MEFTDLIKIKTLKRVKCYVDQFKTTPTNFGTINISSHILCYESFTTKLQIQHTNIHYIEVEDKRVVLRCKNFEYVAFSIPNKLEQELLTETLRNLSKICDIDARLSFPFYCRPKSQIQDYLKYDETHELAWLELPRPGWRISYCNVEYKICKWYGKLLVTPNTMFDVVTLQLLAESRTEQRLPRPTFLYKHSLYGDCMLIGSGEIVDSLQYKIQDTTLREIDLDYMSHVTGQGTLYTATHFKGLLLKRHYEGWTVVFMKMPYISDLKACIDEMTHNDTWLSGNRKWLDFIWDIMLYLDSILLNIVENGHSILVEHYTHCLLSLSQLCLESRYRTLYGLYSIIYKEWLHAGYKFQTNAKDNCSSEFLLFLSCLRQLLIWFPTSFQYTEDLLIFLHESANASKYGDFLGDCDQERTELRVSSKTIMIWGTIFSEKNRASFINPVYKPQNDLLTPMLGAPETVSSWPELFCRNTELDWYRRRVKELRWRLHQ